MDISTTYNDYSDLDKNKGSRRKTGKKKRSFVVRLFISFCTIFISFMAGVVFTMSVVLLKGNFLTVTEAKQILQNKVNSLLGIETVVEETSEEVSVEEMETTEESTYDEEEIAYELKAIQSDAASEDIDMEYRYLVLHESEYPEKKVLQAKDNPGLTSFLYHYGKGDYELTDTIELADSEKQSVMPILMQWDSRWGYEEYGSSVIGITGCGPTCLSMIVIGLVGDTDATPKTIADFATENGYYVVGTGTKWSLMTAVADEYNLTCTQLKNNEENVLGYLKKGYQCIVSVSEGHFTYAGHFIVIAGEDDGKLIIHDPNSIENSTKLWDYEDIKDEIKNIWAFK